MKVVLREDVEKLGLRGEVVDVARGYARNFLLPRRLAEPATPARVKELEKVNSRRALSEAQSFEQAQEIAQRLGQAELRFDVKAGETGVLFGSVTQTQLADAIWDKLKVRVDRRKIGMDESLKRIGRYQIPIELFADVTVETRVLVSTVTSANSSDRKSTRLNSSHLGISYAVFCLKKKKKKKNNTIAHSSHT